MPPIPPDRRPERWAPLTALFGGVVALVLWVYTVRHAMPRSGRTLERAKEIGLVSWTTLTGYDTAQEANAWLLGCILVPLGLWAGWLAFGGSTSNPESPSTPEDTSRTDQGLNAVANSPLWPPPPWVPWLAMLTVVLSVVLRLDIARNPNPWGSFGLLGEEGVYLGAVQAMRTGRTLYADLAFPYGPLLIQPFELWLRIAGDTVVASRVWVLLLHGLGLGAVGVTVYSLLGPKRGPWAAAAATAAMAAVSPPFLPVLNSALLRPAMALVPAALLHGAALGHLTRLRHPWRWVGASLAVACLISFEVAAVAVVTTGVAAMLHRPNRADFQRAALWAAGAGGLLLLPLTIQGGLVAFVGQALEMLRLPALGYQALPYPDVAGVFEDAGGRFGAYMPQDTATRAWATLPPLGIWAGLGVGLCALGRARSHHTTGIFLAALAGALLFRGALGRSDLYHLWFYGAVPLVVLGAIGFALLWDAMSNEVRAGLLPLAAACVVGVAALETEQGIAFPAEEEMRLAAAVSIDDPLLPRTLDVGRTGPLRALPRLAAQVDAITRRASSLPKDDGVWFYPNEAAYYYLADRAVPIRYLWAYDAATPDMQQRAIADLEASPPKWVFHSSDTFEIDHIPQEDLVPLLDAWLAANYRPVQVLPGATLLERVGAPAER